MNLELCGHGFGVHTRSIGDVRVSAVGLGAMPLSVDGRPSPEQARATIAASLEAGVTLVDTADAYSLTEEDFGANELLVAEVLRELGPSDVLVATKGGHTRLPGGDWGQDGRPEYLREAAQASCRRLGVEAIGLYQYHRPDPDVPWAESMGALRELLDAGTIRMAGVSNADPEQIREAREIIGDRFVSVQNEFSPSFRSSEPEIDVCAELGLAFLPWSPLGGIGKADGVGGEFAAIGQERGVSPQQVCLAWMLAKADVVIPIPGSRRPETARDSAGAADLELSAEELARLG